MKHLACVGLYCGICALAQAQGYPTRTIRMVVPWPPGGGTDVIARILFTRMAEPLKQQVVIDNRGGASTIIGTENIVKSAPDGYTMGFVTSNLVVNPALFDKLPYDALRDLVPVILAARGLYSIGVHPSLPAKTVKELIALSKAAPDRFNVSMSGAGTPTHLALAQYNTLLGVTLNGIQYKGAAPAVTALLSGETQLMFVSYPSIAAHVTSGRVRILAVTSAQRSSALPQLPTAIEGGLPGFVIEEWYGVVAPVKTERTALDRINDETRKVLALPEVKERLAAVGAEGTEGAASSGEAFGAFLRSETTRWAKVVKAAGVKVE